MSVFTSVNAHVVKCRDNKAGDQFRGDADVVTQSSTLATPSQEKHR